MGTEVVKLIGTGGGVDYADVDAFLAGEARDLVNSQRVAASSFSGTFTADESLSFGTSGATATLLETDDASFLRYVITSGTPQAGETITGDTSGTTATIDSITYTGEKAVGELEAGIGEFSQPVQIDANNYAFTTSAASDDIILIRPQAGGEHTGKDDASVVLHGSSGADPLVNGSSTDMVFEGVQFQTWDPGSVVHRELAQWSVSDDNTYFDRCVAVVGDSNVTAFAAGSGDFGPFWYNGVILGEGTSSGSVAFAGHTGGAAGKSGRIYNSTIYNVAVGIDPNNSDFDVRNVVCFGCTEAFDDPNTGSYDAASTNNADDRAGAATSCTTQGIGTIDDVVAGDFTDTAANDLSLASGSKLIDVGADLSGAPFPITDDIIETARPQGSSYDIGAFEATESGVSATAGLATETDTAFAVTAELLHKATFTVQDTNGSPVTNEANVEWWSSDSRNAAPTDSTDNAGALGSTDGSGQMTIEIPNTTQPVGGTVIIEVKLSDGRYGEYEATVS